MKSTAKSTRPPFTARPFLLINKEVVARIQALLGNVPIDPLRPLQLIIREQVKQRGRDANALMWAGPLKDISEQAWLDGRQFSAEIWHEWAKRNFLPDEYDPELCLEGYQKWAIDPSGERVLIGSTTKLTVRGMSEYIEQLHAAGSSLGVEFHANPMDGR